MNEATIETSSAFEEQGEPMRIGTFARRSLLSLKALRIYEEAGLLTPDHVDPRTGYRLYGESQLPAARMIAMLRRLDMSLSQIREVLGAPPDEAAGIVAEWWRAAEDRHAGQRELARYVRQRLHGQHDGGAVFPVEERDCPAQVVISETHPVTIGELPGLLASVSGRLIETALAHGGLTDHVFVIYHGRVDEDSDGPVEVCVPVRPDAVFPEGVRVTLQPATRQAFVRLRKSAFAWPQILGAYDAVEQWALHHGGGVAGPSREVYYPGFPTAAGDEIAGEIACPIP